ncbi:MAG: serine/threonine protein kinase [Acidobacteriia bacterium]|nr:serine/threonine protein kinase [Terriglobia bacterium]
MNDPADQNTVTTDTFRRIRRIFEEALERPAGKRRAFVENACAGDAAILREVNRMLDAEGQADPLLDGMPSAPPSSSAPEEGRFPAGTVLAGRYRILGLLGTGGMGEVYKAFDLILNQTVALKFLNPAHISEAALIRFRNEVRIARQVSHPNVCRVYDLGMVEGLHFLSMEYIDGEDLASLLRRIGRLPQDKAIEFTRKICAGLSAAHERGVLHRDLKPANIMIDARGQVRITDFGLAALAQEIPLSDLRSGTPAYMSPEQKAGKEVTTRSDIYSLGLVLHEMFTGKARKDTQSSPSELVKDLDPAIERLILRCLEDEPRRRPQTPLNVAIALPGADPIAAALAAGETPSPEMVAASGEKEGFRPRTAVLCLVAVVLSLIVGIPLAQKTSLLGRAPLKIPPEVLAYRAQEILNTIGYTQQPRSTAYGFECCDQQAIDNLERYGSSRRDEILVSHQPPIISFWYRQHQREFDSVAPFQRVGAIGPDTPPNSEPEMIRVLLDAKGRLVRLEVRPWETVAETREPGWPSLFSAAGLDPARFKPAAPEHIPPMSSDARTAWIGTYADNRSDEVRVEAASWQNRPVFFEVRGLSTQSQPRIASAPNVQNTVFLGLLVICLAAAALTARRNLRQGRGDRRGAAVFASAAFVIAMTVWALGAGHVASIWEIGLLIMGLSWSGFASGGLWLFYLAIEPHARRHWPDSLISWTRLYNGQLHNPLVASHILAGITAAEVYELWVYPGALNLFSTIEWVRDSLFAGGLESTAHTIAGMFSLAQIGMALGLGLLLMVVLLRLVIPKLWVADLLGAFLLSLAAAELFGSGIWRAAAGVAFTTAVTSVWIWLLRRFGFLAMLVAWLASSMSYSTPLVIAGWLAGRTLALNLIPAAIASWAVWVIVATHRPASSEGAE